MSSAARLSYLFRIACLFPVLLVSFSNAPARHDFHMSKGQVEYVAAEKSLQITLHLFIDDVEDALALQGVKGLQLGTEKEAAQADERLAAYLRQHFSLTLNGSKLNLQFLGKETTDDMAAIWCYLLVEQVALPQDLRIQNSLLTDLFDDQKNILTVVGPAGKKSTLLFEKHRPVQSVTY
jgi:hypothetical protein